MPRVLPLALAVLAVLVALTLPAGASALKGYHSCPSVKDIGPTGMDPADAVQVRVAKVGCARATRLIKAYTPVATRRFASRHVRIGAFVCTNSYPRVYCKARGGKRVRFRDDG